MFHFYSLWIWLWVYTLFKWRSQNTLGTTIWNNKNHLAMFFSAVARLGFCFRQCAFVNVWNNVPIFQFDLFLLIYISYCFNCSKYSLYIKTIKKGTQSEHTKIKSTHIVSNHMIYFPFRRIDKIHSKIEHKVSIAYHLEKQD